MLIEISNRQSRLKPDETRICRAVQEVLKGESIVDAEINIAIVDNAQIHDVNRRFLDHDFATDVITFPMNDEFFTDGGTESPSLQGDIMVSAEFAQESATKYGWSPNDELLLYIVHGTLHLTGYDDGNDEDRRIMRSKEAEYLLRLGMNVPENHTRSANGDAS